MRTPTRLRTALVLLLVGSGLLFAAGSTIERHQHHAANRSTPGTSSTESGSGESGTGQSAEHAATSQGETGATLLGVDTESVALTVIAAVASLALALAVWLGRRPRLALLCVAGFGLVFAAGDGRELVHQLDESSAGLAAIAAVLLGLHLAVTGLAAALLRRGADSPVDLESTRAGAM